MPDSTPSEPTPSESTPLVSSTSGEILNPDSGSKSAGDGSSLDESDESCPFLDNCLWCLIVLIVLDILLIILLIILIIFVRRGAKKMKAAAMAAKSDGATELSKKKSQERTNKTEAETGTVMCEMDGTKGTEDGTNFFTVKGKGKATEDGTNYFTVRGKGKDPTEEGTKFFTVDSEFQTPSKKKNKKKGKK